MTLPGGSWEMGAYRYGFNGQEKSPEIDANHTTAEFWEYDALTARRWNQDPKSYAFISNYAVFADNPILFTDPNGMEVDDDIFSRTGKFIRRTATGNNILVEQANGSPKKLSESYTPTKDGLVLVRGVIQYYLRQVGSIPSGGAGIGVDKKREALMFYSLKDKSIRVNVGTDNKLSSSLDNISVFKTAALHENIHSLNDTKNIEDNFGVAHAKVYAEQMRGEDFRNAPINDRVGLATGMVNHLREELKGQNPDASEVVSTFLKDNVKIFKDAGLNIMMKQVGGCTDCVDFFINNRKVKAEDKLIGD
jgi:hypothetical protein